MANFHLLLTVPGQTRMNCGELISFALPNQRPVQHDQAQSLNPYYSGRYLILSLKHKFDVVAQKHTMNMKCVKDVLLLIYQKTRYRIYTDRTKVVAQDIYKVDERYTLK